MSYSPFSQPVLLVVFRLPRSSFSSRAHSSRISRPSSRLLRALLLFSTAVLRLSNRAFLHFLLFALSIANSPLLVAHAFFLFYLNGHVTRRAVDFT